MPWYDRPTLIRNINKGTYYVFGDESGDIKGLKSTIKKYAAGEIIKERDATFTFTSVFISPKCLESLYASFQNIKKQHFSTTVRFHASEIESRKGIYSQSNMSDADYQNFIIQLDEEVGICKYKVQVTSFNKWAYVYKHNITDANKASLIIRKIYKSHFLRVEKMLMKFDKNVVMVLEESSDPKMDKLILKEFLKLRWRKSVTHIKALYFTNKNANMYPAGTELADIVSQSMFRIFSHPKCIISLRKVYRKDPEGNLDLFEYK